MRRLIRLLAILIAGALVTTAAAASVALIGHGIVTHGASATAAELAPLSTATRQGSTVYAADGSTVLAVLHDSVNQKPVPLSAISPTLVNAVLDTEDAHFFLHGGFDIPSTIRALASDSSSGGGLQGGSTITQQLVKQVYLTSQRKLSRKIKEAVIADRLQQKYSKDQILDTYLNLVYFGDGAYGVEAAAENYFNATANTLTLPQAALLGGLIQDPNGYDPLLHPAAARTRRTAVLGRMVHYGHITPPQAAAANADPVPTPVTTPPIQATAVQSNYVQEVENELLLSANSPIGGNYSERYAALFEGGLKIYTNLDPYEQQQAELKTAADTPKNAGGYEEAMVVIDPTTGKVRALVGGVGQQQYDVITGVQGRQPGSGFKVFTLLAALASGASPYDTVDGSSPCAIDFPASATGGAPNTADHDYVKTPAHNDEGNGGGVETLVQATAQSTNCAYMRLAHEVTLQSVVNMAHRLGVTSTIPLVPSIVIGAAAVPPLQMAGAYATVADDGVYHKPSFIDHIVDNTGSTVYKGLDPGHRVISQQVAREAEIALNAVVSFGTGTAAGLPNRMVAGKTGTTENNDDAWFNGFVPQLEATVWMGALSGEHSMVIPGHGQVFGGDYPAQTWHDFMAAALALVPPVPFPAPDPSQIPTSRYIDSPALERDDHTGHNFVAPPAPPRPPSRPAPPSATTVPGSPVTTSPATTPVSPPATTPPTAPTPPTTKKAG